MGTRRLEAVGTASPEVAWGRYLQIAAWPTWSPQIRRVQSSAERLAVGVVGPVYLPGGLGLPFTITAVNAQARSWSWVVRLGLVRLTLNHEVRAHSGLGHVTGDGRARRGPAGLRPVRLGGTAQAGGAELSQAAQL